MVVPFQSYDINSFINKIILGDTLKTLQKIPSKSVDLIFADPPYFMQTQGVLERVEGTKFNGVEDDWDKFADFEEYDEFTRKWLVESKRVLKDNGTLWVIGSFQNIFRVGKILQDLGFWILNDIIWKKTNPVPNFKGTRFTNAHETLIWCTKSKNSKYTFNYKTMKYLNRNKQMPSVWEIGICIGSERLRDENGNKLHSTQKPKQLLFNIILSSSKFNDIVLDPFVGTGTTAAVAKRLGRRYIGIDNKETYVKAARERAEKTKTIKDDEIIIKNLLDKKPPNVQIKKLIETGYIEENSYLYTPDKKQKYKLNRDGKLINGEEVLSIHKMAAKILNKINHNGWDFWFIKQNEQFISINNIRKKYRKEVLNYEEIKFNI